MKTLIMLIVILGISGGGYYQYRGYQIQSAVKKLGKDIRVQDLIKYGPMKCESEGGGFTSSMKATLYVANDKAVSNYSNFSTPGQHLEGVHTLYQKDGAIYFWRDSDTTGLVTNSNEWVSSVEKNDPFTEESFTCSPWWNPDTALVSLPETVTFKPMPKSSF